MDDKFTSSKMWGKLILNSEYGSIDSSRSPYFYGRMSELRPKRKPVATMTCDEQADEIVRRLSITPEKSRDDALVDEMLESLMAIYTGVVGSTRPGAWGDDEVDY